MVKLFAFLRRKILFFIMHLDGTGYHTLPLLRIYYREKKGVTSQKVCAYIIEESTRVLHPGNHRSHSFLSPLQSCGYPVPLKIGQLEAASAVEPSKAAPFIRPPSSSPRSIKNSTFTTFMCSSTWFARKNKLVSGRKTRK